MHIQHFYRVCIVSGSTIGVAINTLVLFVIYKNTSQVSKLLSRILVVSSTYDICFSLLEMVTQHELLITDGILFVIPKGIETYINHDFRPFLFAPHILLCCMGSFILPAQYQYRYALLTNPNKVTLQTLTRNVGIAFLGAASCSVFASLTLNYQREFNYHEWQMIFKQLRLTEGPDTYIYNMDTSSWFTFCYFIHLGVTLILFWVAAVYYFFKIRAFLHSNANLRSDKTRSMQLQFTRVIFIQGLNTFLFAFIPLTITSASALSNAQFERLGLFVMIPLCWLPVANGIFSIVVIKKYKEYVLRFMGWNLKIRRLMVGSSHC